MHTGIQDKDRIEILVVEDSLTQAEELKFILEKRGFKVSVASNGKTALAFLRTHKPDIVITDIMMPEMDGYELCKEIGSDPDLTDMPVILVTALTDPMNVLRGLEVGANNFITKPYDEGHLVSRIEYLVANKGSREAHKTGDGINVLLSGQVYHITADRPQILDLLLSTYENAARQNRELIAVQNELLELNERLEETVQERNAEIARRKTIEAELEKAQDGLERRVEERTAQVRKMADLLDLTHDTIFVRDTGDRITYWNRGAEETYGWSRKEALGKTPHELLQTRFPDSHESMKRSLMNKDRWEGELVHTKKDGAEIVVASRQVLLRDENGRPLDILEINIDITAQKQAEEQFRQAHKMEALGTLAGGIAHDFNNLLGAIIGFTELIQEDLPEGSPVHRHAGRVMEAGIRGRELVKQMLTFCRKTEQETKPVLLSSVVKESVNLLRASIPTTISINEHVTSESGPILADPVQIQQVLMNLCANAYHAMRETGGALDIELSDFIADPSDADGHGIEPGPYMKLTVSDTGTGMQEQIRDRIFDPFFTTKAVGEGTGLGLSVVLGIVKQSGGHITVESRPGMGSTFSVYFPKIASGQTADTAAEEGTMPTGTERVLFVDDEEALLEMGRHLLTKLGYKVTCSPSSEAALALVRENPSGFDLVITDQTMPDMTGVELARQILDVLPDMPIILCTGFSYLVDSDSARKAGIKGFAMKPLTKRELAKTIREALDT